MDEDEDEDEGDEEEEEEEDDDDDDDDDNDVDVDVAVDDDDNKTEPNSLYIYVVWPVWCYMLLQVVCHPQPRSLLRLMIGTSRLLSIQVANLCQELYSHLPLTFLWRTGAIKPSATTCNKCI